MLCGWFAEKAGRIGEMAARWGMKAPEAPQAQNPGSRTQDCGYLEPKGAENRERGVVGGKNRIVAAERGGLNLGEWRRTKRGPSLRSLGWKWEGRIFCDSVFFPHSRSPLTLFS